MAHRYKKQAKRTAESPIVPVILAAGKAPRLGFPQARGRFGGRSALRIALENCAGLAAPVVVLGYRAAELRALVPSGARLVVNRSWRAGQLSSLLAGLRIVPRDSPFLLYPVDHPLLTPAVIRRLVAGFRRRRARQTIVVPVCHGRKGHPVIFCPTVRDELAKARTAQEVVEKDSGRVKFVSIATPAIARDFDTPAEYRRCQRAYRRKRA